jgi:hypothetical protein
LFGFKRDIKKEKFFINWKEHKVKLTIHHEHRKDSRVSISKSGVNIRLPLLLPEFEKKRLIDKFVIWAKERLDEKPYFHLDKYKSYKDGDELELFDKTYLIRLKNDESAKNSAQVKQGTLIISASPQSDQASMDKLVSQLIYKLIAKKYKPIVWDWLNDLNAQHNFGELKSIRMKNNSTNWGSCSNKGNINISVRLLLAPREVVDYVLIHELAHLQQQNHGAEYWKIVEKACPNFKKYEKWLKSNARKCII